MRFPFGIDAGVIIVIQLGGGDAVVGEDHGSGDGDLVGEVRRRIGGVEDLAAAIVGNVQAGGLRSVVNSISGTGCR